MVPAQQKGEQRPRPRRARKRFMGGDANNPTVLQAYANEIERAYTADYFAAMRVAGYSDEEISAEKKRRKWSAAKHQQREREREYKSKAEAEAELDALLQRAS